MNDMVNVSELLRNVVILGRRKMLRRLDQNGMRSGMGAVASPIVDGAPPANWQYLPHSMVITRNEVSPMDSRQGKWIVRNTDNPAGKGWWKKRRPFCNEADTVALRQHHRL
jgi:hypothetical protein